MEHLNESPPSYLIRTENGNILRRNRKHILLRKGGNSDSYFKNETDMMSTYLVFMIKQIKLLTKHQIIYVSFRSCFRSY